MRLQNSGDAFHPFCISRRVPVWLCLLALVPPCEGIAATVLRSIGVQTEYLLHHLETDVSGNHLLENARALVFAGVAVDGPRASAWLERGVSLVRNQLSEQVLSHGEHFERSPKYHAEMLDLVREVGLLTTISDPQVAQDCDRYQKNMAAFVETICHPDGDIPLLGDSTLAERVAGHGEPVRPSVRTQAMSATVGEYWVFRDSDDFLLFDAGPVGPDHLPAHAHSDLLTIEASWRGQRLIVDSGVFDYEASEMRQYCRSTAAHNVLEVDGENQCDVWSRFRMGRRGWPTPLQHGHGHEGAWAGATHNAYRHRSVRTVGRFVYCASDQWLVCDWAQGRGEHSLVNRLHFHPGCRMTMVKEALVRIEQNNVTAYLEALGTGALKILSGWYCPRFGERYANSVVEFHASGLLPNALGWRLTRVQPTTLISVSVQSRGVEVQGHAGSEAHLLIDVESGRLLNETV